MIDLILSPVAAAFAAGYLVRSFLGWRRRRQELIARLEHGRPACQSCSESPAQADSPFCEACEWGPFR